MFWIVGMLRRIFVGLVWFVGLALGAILALALLIPHFRPTISSAASSASPATPTAPVEVVRAAGDGLVATPPPVVAAASPPVMNASLAAGPMITDCSAKGYDAAAAANAASLRTLAWEPFHRPEIGWEIYAPRIAQEIGLACGPDSPGFAQALSRWQKQHRMPATGMLDEPTFKVMNGGWEMQRPFVRVSAAGVCPQAPSGADLTPIAAAEAYGGKAIKLRGEALDAYRRMVAAARAETPAIEADHHLLTVISGYRTPEDDTARCAKDNDCGNVTRAYCSAHRTGLAIDIVLGGGQPLSSDDANRLRQSKTPAYVWMVANAGRFGWVNYPFEPWHWEWTGAAQ